MRFERVFRLGFPSFLATILVLSTFPPTLSSLGQRGPKIDRLQFKVITGPDAQLLAMQTGEVDVLTDLTRTGDIEKLANDGFTITSSPSFHMGQMVFNIRFDQNYRGAGKRGKVLSDVNFRHALFHSYDQDEICASIHGYTVTPIHSLVTPAQGFWANPSVPRHPCNFGDPTADSEYPEDHSSCGILRHGGYKFDPTIDPNHWWLPPGNWVTPYDLDGDGIPGTNHPDRPLTITDPDDVIPDIAVYTPREEILPIYTEHTRRWVDMLKEIGLGAVWVWPGGPCGMYEHHLYYAYFDIALVVWSVGRFPDQLYALVHSSQDAVTNVGGSNIAGINDPTLDFLVETVEFNIDPAEKRSASYASQYQLYDENNPQALAFMPLYSRLCFSAFNPDIQGVVSSDGFGSDNGWTWLNAHWKQGAERTENGDTIIKYSFGEEPEDFNPLHSTTASRITTWGQVLDELLIVNPYTHEDLPWLADSWTVTPTATGMEIVFTLNSTVEWHDGNAFTAEDARFNWLFLRDNEIPAWSSTWEHIVDVEVMGTSTVKVYLDVTSQWALYDLSETGALLAPPVWAPLDGKPLDEILGYDPSTNTTTPAGAGPKFGTSECPTQLYGTGPFVFESYNATGMIADLHANRDYFKTTDEIQAQIVEMFHRIGDVNRDGWIDILDLTLIAVSYGCFEGEPEYDPEKDLNEDGVIDIRDLALVCRHYGKPREHPEP